MQNIVRKFIYGIKRDENMKFVRLVLLLVILLMIAPANAKKIDRKVSIQTVYDTITQGAETYNVSFVTCDNFCNVKRAL